MSPGYVVVGVFIGVLVVLIGLAALAWFLVIRQFDDGGLEVGGSSGEQIGRADGRSVATNKELDTIKDRNVSHVWDPER